MTVKRFILGLLTLLAFINVFSSLGGSLAEPQIQSRLELYQTNLVLYASGWKPDADNGELSKAIAKGLGENPATAAIKQYDKVRSETIEIRDTFEKQLKPAIAATSKDLKESSQEVGDLTVIANNTQNNQTPELSSPRKQLKQQVTDLNGFIDEIDLKRGILAAEGENVATAKEIWQQLITRIDDPEDEYSQTASVLNKLWSESPQVTENSETIITDNLDSWFRDRSLAKIYTITDNTARLASLNEAQQQIASQAVVKLAVISGIPVFGGFIGFILSIFLLVQLFVKKENSVLATNANVHWETPWDWETTWQVIIVGFFFVGQFVLPFFLSFVGFNVAEASLRAKALYVLFTYILMALGGIIVLYLSIKPYLPLPQE